MRIRSEKLREHQHTEGYIRCLESKRLELDESRNEQFRRKMNQDIGGNRKLFWKEVSKANGG